MIYLHILLCYTYKLASFHKYRQNKENYSIKNLQNKSYSLKKKKSAFSEEDQNLIKRFKKSVDENKALCITLQKSENINYFNNHNLSFPCSINATLFTPTTALNNIDMNLR